jgi:hypothetical protein
MIRTAYDDEQDGTHYDDNKEGWSVLQDPLVLDSETAGLQVERDTYGSVDEGHEQSDRIGYTLGPWEYASASSYAAQLPTDPRKSERPDEEIWQHALPQREYNSLPLWEDSGTFADAFGLLNEPRVSENPYLDFLRISDPLQRPHQDDHDTNTKALQYSTSTFSPVAIDSSTTASVSTISGPFSSVDDVYSQQPCASGAELRLAVHPSPHLPYNTSHDDPWSTMHGTYSSTPEDTSALFTGGWLGRHPDGNAKEPLLGPYQPYTWVGTELSLMSSHHTFDHTIPDRAPQRPSSPVSTSVSSSVPDVLHCSVPDCRATFHGRYRRGNRSRHQRLSHHGAPASYPCEHTSCDRIFRRPDARLKHQRKHHPHLVSNIIPALRRQPRGGRMEEERNTLALGEERRATGITDLTFSRDPAPPSMGLLGQEDDVGLGVGASLSPELQPFDLMPEPSTPHALDRFITSEPEDERSTAEGSRVVCDLCETTFQRSAELRRHMQKHEEPAHACEVMGCNRSFYRMDKLRDHVRQAHKGKIIAVENGQLAFDVPEEVEITKLLSSFPCAHCDVIVQTAGELNKHVYRRHFKRFTCLECEAAFHLKADLLRHQSARHGDNRKEALPCPNPGCTYTASRRDNLMRHERLCKYAISAPARLNSG